MAVIKIAHHPDLMPERAMQVFDGHFSRKYEVYKTAFPGRDFVVKKSGWTGVGVKLEQDKDGTSFVFSPLMPNVIFNMLFGNLIAILLLRSSWKALEKEVRVFIENAADFR